MCMSCMHVSNKTNKFEIHSLSRSSVLMIPKIKKAIGD